MNKIKYLINACVLSFVMSLGIILGGCSDNETTVTPEVKPASTELNFPNSGGTQILTIQTNIPLELVSANASWCTISKIEDTSSKEAQYNVTATSNSLPEARQTKITVSGSGYTSDILVNQTAGDQITITDNPKSVECDKAGDEFTVNVNANGEFSITTGKNWISVIEQTNTSIKFGVAANLGTARTDTISFTCGTAIAKFVVKQVAAGPPMSSDEAMALSQSLGLGWNLGNQLDASNNGVASETAWGNMPTTQEAFNKIAASGIKSVRIPITWLGQIGAAPTYTIKAAWLNRVAEVVNYAENAGLTAIINIHHDGADSKNWLNIKDAATSASVNTKVKAQLKAMWTQIADKFKDKGNFLIFESMNEIHDGGWGWGANLTDGGKQYAVLNEWNQVFVDAVRATGGNNSNRYLAVPGYCTNPDLTIKYFKLPSDEVLDKLFVAVHYYDPYEYTLTDKYTEWGHTGAIAKKATYGDEADMKSMFGKLKAKFIDNGIPMYIGEFGNVHRSTDRAELFRKYYLEYLCKAAKTYGLAPFFWDNGSTGAGKECSGLLNHATGDYINNGKDMIDTMVKAINNSDVDYTLDTVYNGAPQ